LPTAVGATTIYTIKKKDTNGTIAVTLATTSSQTIDGASTFVIYGVYQSVTLVSDNANWWIA
ncbi:MAG TPA: hypothetical protein VEP90_04290, partial [Methylomirabilota bacterium]|nr:hypothetical protein [Methylomirabilota bacterium]